MNDRTRTGVMDEAALEMVLGWAADEGWNPGIGDAATFFAADPQGFFLTYVDDDPVAAVSVVNHDPANAFLGLYICRPNWRGQGYGMATWESGIAHAGARSIGLDGVPEQEGNYRLSGFVKTGSSLRHEGRIEGRASPHIRAIKLDDAPALIALDAEANGFARPQFMRSWLTQKPDLRGTRVLLRDGAPSGFATWRACRSGTKIGPVIAPDLSGALDLVADIALRRPDGPLIIDVPETNTALLQELDGAGFTVPFVTARMYRGAVPNTAATLQSIATMELG